MKSLTSKLLISFYITIVFYIAIFLIFPEHWVTISNKWMAVVIDLVTFPLALLAVWEINGFLQNRLDNYYKWNINPVKRLFVQVFSMSVISLIIVLFTASVNGGMTFMFYPDMLNEPAFHKLEPLMHSAAYIFIALFLFFQSFYIAAYFYKRWISSSLEAERLKSENIHAHLHALQNQSHPHFLFNTLNTLTSLIEEDQKTAIEFVGQLANFYRYILQRDENHIITLAEEIKFISSYLFLQQKRFGDNLKIDIHVSEKSNEKFIPIYVLLILFENAVKHNIISSEKPLYIKVAEQGENYLSIENNLQPRFSTAPSTGYGLSNIVNRYKILSKHDIEIVKDNQKFKVVVPLLGEKPDYECADN